MCNICEKLIELRSKRSDLIKQQEKFEKYFINIQNSEEQFDKNLTNINLNLLRKNSVEFHQIQKEIENIESEENNKQLININNSLKLEFLKISQQIEEIILNYFKRNFNDDCTKEDNDSYCNDRNTNDTELKLCDNNDQNINDVIDDCCYLNKGYIETELNEIDKKNVSDCEELTPNAKKSPNIISCTMNGSNNNIIDFSGCDANDFSKNNDSKVLEKPPKKSILKRRINIINWIVKYDKNTAISDLIAGLTLGLTIIPQSIAYASLAGLPSQYGLYAAFMGAFVYVIVGTVKEVSIGPTSLMALLTLQYTYNKPPEFAVILAFLAGIVELIMGLLNIGFIVDFISDPVTSAFTSATALIVIVSQLKNLLGIRIPAKDIADTIIRVCAQINEIRFGDTLLGCACICFLLSLRQLNLLNINKSRRILKKILWYISISRNALCVCFTSAIAYYLTYAYGKDNVPIILSGNVESGVPSFALPPFSIEHDGVTYNFLDILRELGSGIIIVPLVGMLANVAIAKAFAADGNLDASQEMFSLGLCNIACSFFSGIPTCGAFTRSAVSNASGVKTPMAGIYSGTMVILALSLLTPLFKYIPRATLAAVLTCAVVYMMDLKIAVRLYKESKKDFIGWLCCFIISLALGVEIGLLSGIVISIIFLLMKLARPKIIIHVKEVDKVEYIHVRPSSEIFYTAIDYLRSKVNKACLSAKYRYPVVIDCDKINQLDYTSIKTINLLAKELNGHDVSLIIHNMRNKLQKYLDDSQNIKFCSGKLTTNLFIRKSINDANGAEFPEKNSV